MPNKEMEPSETSKRISLFEVQRLTKEQPARIIRRCNNAWLDCTPVEDTYHWRGRKLTARERDPLVEVKGVYPLTEDALRLLGAKSIQSFTRGGLDLVKGLTLKTEKGILVLDSPSIGSCPPIPTPTIWVPKGILDELSTSETVSNKTNQREKLEVEDTKIPFTPLEEVLFRILKGGVLGEQAIKRVIQREMNKNTRRTYDVENILIRWLNDDRNSLVWKRGTKEEVCKWKTVINKISFVKRFLPKH